MRYLLIFLSIATIALASPYSHDELAEKQSSVNNLYSAGCGAEDGATTAMATSMLGWGLGLSAGIAILAASLHQSTGSNGHSAHCCAP